MNEGKKQEEVIKKMIVSGHKRGVCNSEGESVRGKDGHLTARPRILKDVSRHRR